MLSNIFQPFVCVNIISMVHGLNVLYNMDLFALGCQCDIEISLYKLANGYAILVFLKVANTDLVKIILFFFFLGLFLSRSCFCIEAFLNYPSFSFLSNIDKFKLSD